MTRAGEKRTSVAAPLGPDSLTWRLFGDWRALFNLVWSGSMQNMHPQVGGAVEQYSTFFQERWERTLRSMYALEGGVYDGERAPSTAREIRDYHRGIRGVDPQGRKFNALEPGAFFWVHAVFVMGMVVIARTLGEPLTERQREQLWAEAKQWWALYGMPDPPGGLPEDWAAFQRYWDHMCENELEDNSATRRLLDLWDLPRPPAIPIPGPVWRWMRPHAVRFLIWLTVGMYDPSIRALYGYIWTDRDARRLERLRRTVRVLWRLLPPDRRLHPRARAGWRRARGQAPADAALVHTPERNLPPLADRDSPYHYSPPLSHTLQRRRWRRPPAQHPELSCLPDAARPRWAGYFTSS